MFNPELGLQLVQNFTCSLHICVSMSEWTADTIQDVLLPQAQCAQVYHEVYHDTHHQDKAVTEEELMNLIIVSK